MRMMDAEARGIPYGRPAEVHLSNNHASYIFTWYRSLLYPSQRMVVLLMWCRFGLSAATAIMFYMVLKKPATDVARRVRATKSV